MFWGIGTILQESSSLNVHFCKMHNNTCLNSNLPRRPEHLRIAHLLYHANVLFILQTCLWINNTQFKIIYYTLDICAVLERIKTVD